VWVPKAAFAGGDEEWDKLKKGDTLRVEAASIKGQVRHTARWLFMQILGLPSCQAAWAHFFCIGKMQHGEANVDTGRVS